MTLTPMVPRAALGALTLGALVTLAVPLLPLGGAAQADEKKEETTVTISTSKDREATVLKLEPMKPGETKTVKSESGKAVTVTRTEEGYTIRTGEREIKVRTDAGEDGPNVLLPGGREVHVVRRHRGGDDDEDVNVLVTGDDSKKVVVRKHAFSYRVGEDGGKPKAADVLKEASPKSLAGLDEKSRAAVEKVLQEMLDEGDLLAPGGGLPMVRHAKGDGDGERVRVIVVEEKKEEGAKK